MSDLDGLDEDSDTEELLDAVGCDHDWIATELRGRFRLLGTSIEKLTNDLYDRERQLAEATREGEEQARLLGMSGEREARLLAQVAELERQLAEAHKDLAATVERMQRIESIALAAEAKLRAVGELRDRSAGTYFGKRLDAILGGDK